MSALQQAASLASVLVEPLVVCLAEYLVVKWVERLVALLGRSKAVSLVNWQAVEKADCLEKLLESDLADWKEPYLVAMLELLLVDSMALLLVGW